MKYLVIDFKGMKKILKRNSYKLDHVNGDHFIFKKEGCNHITITKDLNPMVARRLIKQNHLVIEKK